MAWSKFERGADAAEVLAAIYQLTLTFCSTLGREYRLVRNGGWGLVEWLREAKNRGRNFAFAGEIYLLDFFRLTRQPVGRGRFVRSLGKF